MDTTPPADLATIEKAYARYKQLMRLQAARSSFYLFAKYTIGYNNQPNHLITDQAHGELCALLQYTLKDISDYGGSLLHQGNQRVYDTWGQHLPPTTTQSSAGEPAGPLLTPTSGEKFHRPGSTVASERSRLYAYRRYGIDKRVKDGKLYLSTKYVSELAKLTSLDHDSFSDKELVIESFSQSLCQVRVTPQADLLIFQYSFTDPESGYLVYDALSQTKSNEPREPGMVVPPYAEMKQFVLELMPRGTFKSTIGTESFPLYGWLFNPNLRVHICSETLDKALLYAGAVKNSLESNPRYRELYEVLYDVYPDSKRDKWTNSELNLAGRTALTREPNLSCGSPDVPKVGQHYDIILVDDLMGPTNISDTGIEKAINYYKGLLSVLEPGGILVMIGTRWHFKDVYGYIQANEADRFSYLVKSAYNADGSLFFPERLDEGFLSAQRKSQGSYFFSCQYLNKVVDEQDADFKRSYFRNEAVKIDDADNPINVFMSVDPVPPGSETKHDPDYFAITIGGLDKAGALYYLDGWQGRPSAGEAIAKVLELADVWQPKLIGFEAVAFAKLYSFMLKDEMRKRGKYWSIKEIKRTDRRESKAQRIRRLAPYYERGDVTHRLGAGYVTVLEDQLSDFPRGSHDDLLDAFADIVDIGYKPGRNQTSSRSSQSAEDRKHKTVRRPYLNPITRY